MSEARRQRPKTGYSGYLLNTPHGTALVERVGKLIVNFGAIELLSIVWITEMVDDELLLDVAVDMPLSRRIQLLDELVDKEKISPTWAKRAQAAWKRVAELSEIRNIVAHGPVAFTWKERPATGEPDVSGVPVLRHVKKRYEGKLPNVAVEGLGRAVDEVVKVAQELDALLAEYRGSQSNGRAAEQ